jgi:hypothetical protein
MKTFLTELCHDVSKGHPAKDGPHGTRRTDGTYEMGVFDLLDNLDVIELDVEVLVNALEGSLDLNVVLELDGDLMVNEGLEKTMRLLSVHEWYDRISMRYAYLKKSMVAGE